MKQKLLSLVITSLLLTGVTVPINKLNHPTDLPNNDGKKVFQSAVIDTPEPWRMYNTATIDSPEPWKCMPNI